QPQIYAVNADHTRQGGNRGHNESTNVWACIDSHDLRGLIFGRGTPTVRLRSSALLLLSLFYCLAVFADDVHHHDAHDASEKLGTVNFPISCSPTAQKPFERGLALLYSFEYEGAENQFKDVATVDTKCAMAYWGQAMSLFHQLWDRPSEADLKRGHELL